MYAFTVYMYHIHRQPVVVCNESLTAATLLGLALRKECDLMSVGSLAQPLVDLAIARKVLYTGRCIDHSWCDESSVTSFS